MTVTFDESNSGFLFTPHCKPGERTDGYSRCDLNGVWSVTSQSGVHCICKLKLAFFFHIIKILNSFIPMKFIWLSQCSITQKTLCLTSDQEELSKAHRGVEFWKYNDYKRRRFLHLEIYFELNQAAWPIATSAGFYVSYLIPFFQLFKKCWDIKHLLFSCIFAFTS